ncbi:muconolactone Delta-isomerase (plasmid) [Agrobacterium tumefaciens]|jgi:muconolactone D-isomerase|uniref:muconolactone Delta-isomerase n=1 Tax=Agrobacterium TaxID=357 RepID=UPI0008101273|nr:MULTISPECIES: muconolactone Delta-isomerase [Agrobacterium]NSY46456.1 muconolactone Delta-isomerase [Agrobacterium tumefaciens]NSZ76917.1 muconolactone Delta-isomerase [Agrobacterium tumefaciens]NSZ87396.1 muconolactone Delta-isomerase [Agrobacterium tumefaciens]UZX45298.1 muconolactone Delta-isomerase [Agrobacterium sp. 13-2099-1-2]WCA72707.1 muconolactone Delta-isomerase [Agrobacterium tumefaciens]
MLFHVRMDVNIPRDVTANEANEIIAKEKAYSQALQQSGKWRHIWRIAGEYANFSIFDVQDNAELHEVLSGLPLFRFMKIEVTPLLRHPSSVREDDS